MVASKGFKGFFLASFLPAIAYWYLEEYYRVEVAVIGGLCLSIIEIVLEKWLSKKIHRLSWFNFGLIFVLGGLSLVARDGMWFKLQPFFAAFVVGVLIYWKASHGEGFFAEMAAGMNKNPPPKELINRLEKHTGLFLVIYGLWMGVLALFFSTGIWLFFKTAGLYILFFAFMIIEMLVTRWSVRRAHAKIVKRF